MGVKSTDCLNITIAVYLGIETEPQTKQAVFHILETKDKLSMLFLQVLK